MVGLVIKCNYNSLYAEVDNVFAVTNQICYTEILLCTAHLGLVCQLIW